MHRPVARPATSRCEPRQRTGRKLPQVRPVEVSPGVVGIPLASGQLALVDESDLHLVIDHAWFLGPSGHARTKSARANTYMHRLILPVPGLEVDHVNRNPLDNRRCNLRPATRTQNVVNRVSRGKSGFRGVRRTRDGAYEANIGRSSRAKYLGRFQSAEAAARAYDAAAIELYGEFATLNFPASHPLSARDRTGCAGGLFSRRVHGPIFCGRALITADNDHSQVFP